MTPQPPHDASPLMLAEVLCARLCHDLGGIVGTLASLLDMAAEDASANGRMPNGKTAADELVAEARQTATDVSARLSFLRAAWTPGSDDLPVQRLRALAESLAARRRVTLDLSHLNDAGVFSPACGRMVLNLLLLAAESLPRGGTVAISGEADGMVLLTIDGPNAAWPPSLATCLADPTTAAALIDDPRKLQAPLTALIAHDSGLRLTLLHEAGPGSLGDRPDRTPAPLLLDCAQPH